MGFLRRREASAVEYSDHLDSFDRFNEQERREKDAEFYRDRRKTYEQILADVDRLAGDPEKVEFLKFLITMHIVDLGLVDALAGMDEGMRGTARALHEADFFD